MYLEFEDAFVGSFTITYSNTTITITNLRLSGKDSGKNIPFLQPTIISFYKDLPNLCSLAGLTCTFVALVMCIKGFYHLSMIGMIWAVAFDWADGLIARRMTSRNAIAGKFGAQLDILIDIVSYGVTPAILLICYGGFEIEFLAVALIMLFASAFRLSYYHLFGLAGGTSYIGLALDNNSIILVLVFVLESVFPDSFSNILLASCLLLAVLNISEIKTPKLSSNPIHVFMLGAYTVMITGYYWWKYSTQI